MIYFSRPFCVAGYLCKTYLNYIEQSLILVSTIIGYVSISAFASLVGVPIGIRSSAVGKICARTEN